MPIGARKNIGLFLGMAILIMGLLGIFFKLPLTADVIAWILAIGGLYLIVTSVTEIGAKKNISLLVAFAILIIALVQILSQSGIIGFSISNLFVYHMLLAIEGVFLAISAFGT